MTTFHVCGNDETILSSYDSELFAGEESDVAEEFTDAAVRVLTDAGHDDLTVEHSFRDWNGGRMSNQAEKLGYIKCGKVCVSEGASKEEIDLAWKANEAGEKVLADHAAAQEF